MSTKKKTGDKLVASMRKSKTGSVAKKTTQRPDTARTAAKSSPTKSSPDRARKAPSNKPSARADQDLNYSFSRGRRVWPD